MRHLNKGKKFGRKKDIRNALLKSLATALILNGKIKTSVAKAKAVSTYTEKLITKAKKGGLENQRNVLKILAPRITKKLFFEIAPNYKERQGGYTRVIKSGLRKSDASKMAIIEFVK